MAINPVAIVAGEVREVRPKEFLNQATGVIENQGRILTLLTVGGFLEVRIPVAHKALEMPPVGSFAVCRIQIVEWSFNGRTGTTIKWDGVPSPALIKAAHEDYAAARVGADAA